MNWVAELGVFVAGYAALAAVWVIAAAVAAVRATSTVSLAGPYAEPGELLVIGDGEDAQTVVVRRVMPDLTAAHVVIVRAWQPWHRWRFTAVAVIRYLLHRAAWHDMRAIYFRPRGASFPVRRFFCRSCYRGWGAWR